MRQAKSMSYFSGASAASHEVFLRGARFFDEGAFFEAHEAWEELWRGETDEEHRLLMQGLIQVAAGFHKLVVTGSPDSALRLLTKGLAKLDACRADVAGIEIAAFRTQVRACADALAAGRFERDASERIPSALSLVPPRRVPP